jgi:hypothetical protein
MRFLIKDTRTRKVCPGILYMRNEFIAQLCGCGAKNSLKEVN